MSDWVRVDAADKVTGHIATGMVSRPAPDVLEVLGAPPFNGGTYNRATKRVTGATPIPPDPLDPLRAKAPPAWSDTDRATALKSLIGG